MCKDDCTVSSVCLMHAGVAASLEKVVLNIGKLSIDGCRERNCYCCCCYSYHYHQCLHC